MAKVSFLKISDITVLHTKDRFDADRLRITAKIYVNPYNLGLHVIFEIKN